MAESTITKILLRRGPAQDLKLSDNDTGALLDLGEPGFTTDTFRLYVGDGTTNQPVPRVDNSTLIYNDTGAIQMSPDISVQLKTSNTGDGCGISAAICAPNGGIYAGKNINCKGDVVSFCSSDQQLKDNIKIIDNPLDRLDKIKGVTFTWNDKQQTYDGDDTGVIAQDVEQLGLPGVVDTRDDGYKAVKYERLVPLLIESVKQLRSEVDRLSKLI